MCGYVQAPIFAKKGQWVPWTRVKQAVLSDMLGTLGTQTVKIVYHPCFIPKLDTHTHLTSSKIESFWFGTNLLPEGPSIQNPHTGLLYRNTFSKVIWNARNSNVLSFRHAFLACSVFYEETELNLGTHSWHTITLRQCSTPVLSTSRLWQKGLCYQVGLDREILLSQPPQYLGLRVWAKRSSCKIS